MDPRLGEVAAAVEAASTSAKIATSLLRSVPFITSVRPVLKYRVKFQRGEGSGEGSFTSRKTPGGVPEDFVQSRVDGAGGWPPVRLLGLWLVAAPFILSGSNTWATVNGVIAGLLLAALSPPRGRVAEPVERPVIVPSQQVRRAHTPAERIPCVLFEP